MKRLLLCLLLGFGVTGYAEAGAPTGWSVTGTASAQSHYSVGTETVEGIHSAFVRADTDPGAGSFGSLMQSFSAAAYRGKHIRLSGYLRTRDAGSGQLWLRVDGASADQHSLSFDNMQERAPRGSSPRQRYEIVLDVPNQAHLIAMGFLLVGAGEVWADGLKLEVVDDSVPLTGLRNHLPPAPQNLDFSH